MARHCSRVTVKIENELNSAFKVFLFYFFIFFHFFPIFQFFFTFVHFFPFFFSLFSLKSNQFYSFLFHPANNGKNVHHLPPQQLQPTTENGRYKKHQFPPTTFYKNRTDANNSQTFNHPAPENHNQNNGQHSNSKPKSSASPAKSPANSPASSFAPDLRAFNVHHREFHGNSE